ncbi:MAG: Ig domain-containing protein [Alphaproteobacteria bacterium]|nr:Ig domain-containing protein [Alphaproteobacteria bacterium]MBU1526995.1 Ig domain-containing protein [Alphaproteobacteria bacterium]MBU2118531.1 Ig domain-containing protein [Alphaproteobacteria bacterium]MBU2351986.1 Ig domain-containing protein [Alphaproteobacteria bacterium]MBU2382198.1 Ig domain-containing protein [Alphaproteobacteria bacterium]
MPFREQETARGAMPGARGRSIRAQALTVALAAGLVSVPTAFALAPVAGGGGRLAASVGDQAATWVRLPSGRAGSPYRQPLVLGGAPPYAAVVISGALPEGLSVSDGLLQGTPTGVGRFAFTIQVTDSRGQVTTQDYRLDILAARHPVGKAGGAGQVS